MPSWFALLSRPTMVPLASRPSLTLFFFLVGAFLLTLGYHVVQFPMWLSIGIVLAMSLRCIIEFYRWPLPSTTFCGILAIVLLGIILAQYHRIMGRDSGTAFTAGLLTIKFYELRRLRDVSLIIFSCFFVVMSVLLYSQVLELFVYCLIMMWILTALLMRVYTGDLPQDHLLGLLWKSGGIYLQALPFAFVLLVFFPRYTGTLSFTIDDAKIGISDTISPGSIAKLSKDDSTAMYVHFVPPNVPAIDTMYWRGLVLWQYNNGNWTPGVLAGAPVSPKEGAAPLSSDDYVQEITVMAHNQRWLFALDVPVSRPVNSAELPTWSVLLKGNIVQLSTGKLNHMARYDIASSPAPLVEEMDNNERVAGTQLPPSTAEDRIDPRVQELADRLYAGTSGNREQEYIRAVLRFFREGNFLYSAEPGEQGPDWLANFLFVSKKGFCEHFASSFAVLMRLEHIPARLVAGYRGADYNPYSDSYYVSQSNGHAWDEVWFPSDNLPPLESKKGRWLRVDPTSPIPMSGEMPATSSSGESRDTLTSQVVHTSSGAYDNYLPTWARDGMREMQWRRDEIEASWDNLVLSYDPETQLRMAEALGLRGAAPVALALVCLVAGGLCVFFFRKWTLRKEPTPLVEQHYATFCHNMARRGIPRAAWEGPFAYTERVAEAFPDDKAAVQRVGVIVAHARYGPVPADATAHEDLKSLLIPLTASREKR